MTARHTLFALALSVAALQVGASGLDERQRQAIDQLVDGTVAAVRLPSAVVMIDRGGAVLYQRAVGHADLENQVPATVDSAYCIGSITKSFTGLAVAQLVHAGRIDLDAPVTKYLPDYAGPGATVTVRQLLTHSSGLPNYTNEIPGIRDGLSRNAHTRQQMVGLFASRPLNFAPGEKFSYTNSGYYLLGLIIEATSGMDYYAYLQRHVFEPLGLTRTYAGDYAQLVPQRARGYDVGKDGFTNAPPWHHLVPFSAGSLVSTAGDVVRYRRGVFHSSAIPAAVRELVLRTTTLSGGETNTYTLGGLIVSTLDGHRKVSHAGDIWGYASNHAYYPEQDLTIVILTNRQFGAPALSSIETKLARVVLGIPQPQVQDLSLDDAQLARYAGDYRLHPYLVGGDTFGFVADKGKLHLRFGGTRADGPMLPLLAQGDGRFRAGFDDEWTFEFQPATGAGPALRLVSSYRDGTFQATRQD